VASIMMEARRANRVVGPGGIDAKVKPVVMVMSMATAAVNLMNDWS